MPQLITNKTQSKKNEFKSNEERKKNKTFVAGSDDSPF